MSRSPNFLLAAGMAVALPGLTTAFSQINYVGLHALVSYPLGGLTYAVGLWLIVVAWRGQVETSPTLLRTVVSVFGVSSLAWVIVAATFDGPVGDRHDYFEYLGGVGPLNFLVITLTGVVGALVAAARVSTVSSAERHSRDAYEYALGCVAASSLIALAAVATWIISLAAYLPLLAPMALAMMWAALVQGARLVGLGHEARRRTWTVNALLLSAFVMVAASHSEIAAQLEGVVYGSRLAAGLAMGLVGLALISPAIVALTWNTKRRRPDHQTS